MILLLLFQLFFLNSFANCAATYVFSTREAFQMVVQADDFEQNVQAVIGGSPKYKEKVSCDLLRAYANNTEYTYGYKVLEQLPQTYGNDVHYNVFFIDDSRSISISVGISRETGKVTNGLRVSYNLDDSDNSYESDESE